MNINTKSQIDDLLENLSKKPYLRGKYWPVITALNAKLQLSNQTTFRIPHNKFKSAKSTDYENIKDILTTLHSFDIVRTSYKGITILDDSCIVRSDNDATIITLNEELFIYFRDNLQAQVKPMLRKPIPIPQDWRLIEDGKEATLFYKNKILIKFRSVLDNKYRYFRCLYDNHGNFISSKELFEYKSVERYDKQKAKNWDKNKRINRTINDLKKELATKCNIECWDSQYKLTFPPIPSN